VHKSDLVAAVAAARTSSDAADAKARDVEWLQEQLNQTREQLQAARQEALQLQTIMSNMVSKAELMDLKATAATDQQDAVKALRQSICSLELEKTGLEQQLQVPNLVILDFFFLCVLLIRWSGLTFGNGAVVEKQDMVPRKDLSDARFPHVGPHTVATARYFCPSRLSNCWN
jgi:exonuclease VII large subunit